VSTASLDYWLVVPAAGRGERFGAERPKQYLDIAGRSLLEWALAPFVADPRCRGIALALAAGDPFWPAVRARIAKPLHEAVGGAARSDSVRNALAALPPEAAGSDWVLVHDAARPCLARSDLDALLAAVGAAAAAAAAGGTSGDRSADRLDDNCGGLLAAALADTLKRGAAPPSATPAAAAGRHFDVASTVPRESLWRALTPQMFRLDALRAALAPAALAGRVPTDEAQAIEWSGGRAVLVPGAASNLKVTTPADLAIARALLLGAGDPAPGLRIGNGVDVHAFGPGDHVMLGGVRIAHERGIVAHSDGDVVLHALCDALLGAAGLGDIGVHFPDSDARWRGAASSLFVREVVRQVGALGFVVVNADLTVLAEAPRLGPHRAAIRANVAALLGIDPGAVNVKATTTERLGFIGRGEGLVAQASVLLRQGAPSASSA
jgi:2-C-methyl-D-erythritol 2,4-cyclodiphosphate synthase